MIYGLYFASVVGAVALAMMMPRRGYTPARLGGLLGAATLGLLWFFLARYLGPVTAERVYYYIFSGLAIAAAARVITHTRPVYAALWLVMVVLSTAGLLLVLGAEFMAFAMIIIYGGAILVTYMFVIMLASQSGDEGESADYDRVAREPLAAVAAGFVLLAVLLSVLFQPMVPNRQAAGASDQAILATQLTNRTSERLIESYSIDDPQVTAMLARDHVENAERVGLDLFQSHPLGLELAGVILLVSLIGAVVIARQRADEQTAAAPGPGGATVHPASEPGPTSPEVTQSASEGRLGV